MYIPKSSKQASDAADRLFTFARHYLVAITKSEAKSLIAGMYGHGSWNDLLMAIQAGPCSPLDEDVPDSERIERRAIQIRVLMERFGPKGMRTADAETTITFTFPTSRGPKGPQSKNTLFEPEQASLMERAEIAYSSGDWGTLSQVAAQLTATDDREKQARAAQLLELASDRDPGCRINAAMAHIRGAGVKRDVPRGIATIKAMVTDRDLDMGIKAAIWNILGDNAYGLHGGAKEPRTAISCYSTAAENGSAEAVTKLGKIAEIDQEFVRAEKLYRIASRAGDGSAKFSLVQMMILGTIRPDLNELECLLEEAAALGVEEAVKVLPYKSTLQSAASQWLM